MGVFDYMRIKTKLTESLWVSTEGYMIMTATVIDQPIRGEVTGG